MTYLSDYDYIIAGGGAAGLSLLHLLLGSPLQSKTILVVDKDEKNTNDRTWCFWEKGENPFEDIVYARWRQVGVHGPKFSQMLDLDPYAYKMIRGIDFYQYVQNKAAEFDNVHFLRADIAQISSEDDQATLHTNSDQYRAEWIFSSLRPQNESLLAKKNIYLLQHFKGWVIRTPKPSFDPDSANLMDFRIAQKGDCRFMYVLPTDRQTALVEYTIFSKSLLEDGEYDRSIIAYLRDYFQLDDYTIEHEEFGVIPMTDMTYPEPDGLRIVNIGTAGGVTKPSTGYTFMRIQQDSKRIVDSLVKGKSPQLYKTRWKQRFMLYDSTLLSVMANNYAPARDVFIALFKNNPPPLVFKFLDEETSFLEEIRVANSVPSWPFIKGMAKSIY